jgi:phospholipid/cholesterol/gamma-HCH transport system substrate-binding protein
MKGLSIEARVGLLILIAAGLLGAFVFILSGVRLGKSYELFVDFDNPGSVQSGAPVRIGGLKVGQVDEVRYLGGALDPRTGRRALVRMRIELDQDVQPTVHEDALFYVTAQGVLGEQFLAVEPGTAEKPALAPGAIVHGVDPPRLDLALALGYELLEAVVDGIRANREELGSLLDGLISILRDLSGLLHENRARLEQIIVNVETASTEAVQLVTGARAQFIDGEEARRVLRNLDHVLGVAARELEPLLADVRSVAGHADTALATIGPEEQRRIRSTIERAASIAERADSTLADAQGIVAHVRAGEGTVGAMLMDEEIYDDVQELIRDLKHNPWKFFWRE